MQDIKFDQQKIEKICDIIADTDQGLTGSQLQHVLDLCEVEYSQPITPNKRKWFFNCIADKYNLEHSVLLFKKIIECAVNPASYTEFSKRNQYSFLVDGINKVLLLEGYEINASGVIVKSVRAKNLDEIDRRINEREAKMMKRNYHYLVLRYAKQYFVEGLYFEAVFESSKGLSKKVRDLTGLSGDGVNLLKKHFPQKTRILFLIA